MSIEEHSIEALTTEPREQLQGVPPQGNTRQMQKRWYTFLRSPLWICLLLAIIIRVWLIARTHGVIDGDEVLVGVQAEHILHGEFPIYFYGQPYMGSLEAYLVALLIAIGGPSVWTLRGEPILLSLVLVWLTWKLAAAFADAAQLPPYAKRTFMTIAALLAAIPPLYDGILELRTYGGYIETFILMLLLLLSALQLTRRWHAGALQRELALRWAGIGFIIGLGFWIYPLIISAVLAAAIWIVCDRMVAAIKLRQQIAAAPGRYAMATLKGLGLAVLAIPTSLIGFAPALYWGAIHQWQNITYLLGLGISTHRYASIRSVTRAYVTCVAPRVISGAIPKESSLLATIHSFLLVLGLLSILTTAALVAIAFLSQHPSLLRLQRLATLPLLFGACTALIFCTSKASVYVVISCDYDIAGRYATPLVLALPFLFATVYTLASMYIQERTARQSQEVPERAQEKGSPAPGHTCPPDRMPQVVLAEEERSPTPGRPVECRFSRRAGIATDAPGHISNPIYRARHVVTPTRYLLQAILFGFLLIYLGVQTWTYGLTDPGYTFQSAYCLEAPANNGPIIAYLQHEHIHYAWASNWLAYDIVFKTDGSIVAADPLPFLPGSPNIDRIPANTQAVRHADRPTLLVFVHHTDAHPLLLNYLDGAQVTYQAARFPSEPGIDVLVVTPLSRTFSPFESPAFANIFTSCND
jgi:hypothetical protein